ncbi:MAG: hypothetical protein AMJ56_11040, partial [Anaerolineae bacterium SG8_19]
RCLRLPHGAEFREHPEGSDSNLSADPILGDVKTRVQDFMLLWQGSDAADVARNRPYHPGRFELLNAIGIKNPALILQVSPKSRQNKQKTA